ncbi:MAG: hypothetical protein KC619_30220 [Myxococcales bacterium]|nr:hypothetical protein [Myxococcales bacterium]
MQRSFDEYLSTFEQKRAEAEAALAPTGLAELERLVMKVAYLLDAQVTALPSGNAGTVLGALVAKLTNEQLAFSGALRMGALHGAWHHVRAVMELDATVHYLFEDDPSETSKRIEQFVEFGEMAPWARRRRLELDRDAGKITKEQFLEKNLVSDSLVAHATPERIEAWKKLFSAKTEKKLLQRLAWHDGSIKKLFDAIDPTGDLHFHYQVLCHPTHVSPLGHRLSGTGPPRLFGYAPVAAATVTATMFGNVFQVLERLDGQVSGAFNDGLGSEVAAFLARNALTAGRRSKPATQTQQDEE